VDFDFVGILFRWLHILPATIVVGGTYYARFVLSPSSENLSADEKQQLTEQLRSRWAKFVHPAIALLLLSGLVNIGRIVSGYEVAPYYHAVFGVKFLLALAIFYIAIMLTGRSAAAKRLQEKARFWLTVNVVLVTVLVMLSGVLRMSERSPKSAQPDAPEAVATPESLTAEATSDSKGARAADVGRLWQLVEAKDLPTTATAIRGLLLELLAERAPNTTVLGDFVAGCTHRALLQ